jgi:hypothetical protein
MTQSDLQTLYAHPERPQRSILSIYLNVDQSVHSNRNRGFEQQLENLTAAIRTTIHDVAEEERFVSAAHHIQDFVLAYQPRTRGLAIFFDAVDGFFWHQDVGVPIHNQARWNHELFLQPLANVLDQLERYGVVLLDQSRVRLFSVFLGEIEEISLETPAQRATDEIDSFVQSKHVHRLVLTGANEIISRFRDRLPKRLALLVIGTVNLPIDSTAHEVLSATIGIDKEYEVSTEVQTVKEVIRGVSRNERTVAGLGHTLKAVNLDRVWELIYSEGLTSAGFECEKCAALFSLELKTCLYCGQPVHPVGDVVERAVDHAVRKGAKIEVVTGEASDSLNNLGGIAAFLKTRTAGLRSIFQRSLPERQP